MITTPQPHEVLRWPFEPRAKEVGEARTRLRQVAQSQGACPDALDTALLLVSECVTNTVLHARTPGVLTASVSRRILTVSVCDEASALPQLASRGELSATGRGMRLVAQEASAWGVEPLARGKRVWFCVPLDEAASSDSLATS